jgi:Domain of unknown function (DUF4407)
MLDNGEKFKTNQQSNNYEKSSLDDWQEVNNLLDYAEKIKNKCDKLSDRIFLFDAIQLFLIVSIIIFSITVFAGIPEFHLNINHIYVVLLYFWGLLLFLFIEASSRILKIRISTDKKRLDSITELLRENSSLLSKNWSQLEKIQLKIKLSLFDINTSTSPWSKLKKSFSGDFFLWLVGIDASILAIIDSKNETAKYKSLGFVILFTSSLAFISGYYISYISIKSQVISIFLGLIWSIIIFNIDRLIMVSMSIGSSKTSRVNLFTINVVRLVLIILIASTISVPLELAIFKSEIENQISESNQLVFLDVTKKDNNIQRIDDQIRSVSEDIFVTNKNLVELKSELSGQSLSNSKGFGAVAKILEENLKNQLEHISKAERSKYILEKEREYRVLTLEKIHHDKINSSGLVARINALRQLTQESSTIGLASILINIIIVVIEITPITARLLMNDTLYEKVLRRKESEILMSKQEE